ncbi:MAG: FecR domain-containing protein [Candidatus Sericytochromatia bacterium]|nr:FecR domain-containing protein [Candidatus Sericytochromatia bacterium]
MPPLVLALLAASAGAAASAPPPAGPAPVATVIEVQGPVTWRESPRADFREAHGGERLFEGAVVRTGPKGQARLQWRNGGDFRLMPLSELEVPADEGVLLNLGKVWASFQQKLLAPFSFRSPSATAVVRGTILAVGLAPDGTTSVEVLEGRVEVSSRLGGPARMLEPGQSLIVSPFGPLGPIGPVAPPPMPLFDRRLQSLPDADLRPEGAPPGALDWLRGQRAAVRLGPARELERHRRGGLQGPPPRPPGLSRERLLTRPGTGPAGPEDRRSGVIPGPPDGRGLEPRPRAGDATDRRPVAADPAYAFPAGRPRPHGAPPPRCAPVGLPPGAPAPCPPEPPPGERGPGGRP